MNIHEDLSKIGKQLMLSEPFYGVFLSTLNKVVRKDVPTAGVCMQGINYQLAVNEEFWNSLQGDKPKIGLLKHELLHICFNHLLDKDDYPDQELHNVAADIEINQYIAEEYYPSKDLLLPSSYPELNLPLKAGTKVYYGLLKQALESGASPKLQQLMDGLTIEVKQLLANDKSKLQSILYRIDLSEKNIKKALKLTLANNNQTPISNSNTNNFENQQQLISHEIIVRELKKVLTRNYFKNLG